MDFEFEESLYVIYKLNGNVYFIGKDSDDEKIQGLQKALNTFGELNLEYCREGDPFLDDSDGAIYNIHDLVNGFVPTTLNFADVLIYFDDSSTRLGF